MKKRWPIILLFLTGLIIFLYPHIARYSTTTVQKEKIVTFEEELKQVPEEEAEKRVQSLEKVNDTIFENPEAFQDPFNYESTVAGAMESEEFAINEGVFGVLEIPKLNLSEPIYLGATPSNLDYGIGQVEGSSIPIGGINTHSVLAGHRGGIVREHFHHIDKLNEGDEFYIRSLNGTLVYRVTGKSVILPHETDSLQIQEGRDLTTLLTCHPYGNNTHRLLVYAERVVGDGSKASK